MAVDVDKTLKAVIAIHGKLTETQTKAFVADMLKANRYVRNVY